MLKFHYRAIDMEGKECVGYIEAENLNQANLKIFEQGLVTQSLSRAVGARHEPGKKTTPKSIGKVRQPDLILFTKQLATTIRLGVPLPQCLATLAEQAETKALRLVSGDLADKLQEGQSLSRSLANYPRVFSRLYVSMVEAGELTGNLPEVLDRLTYLIEHDTKVANEVKSAFRYPSLVLAALAIAFVVMIGFVIPSFAGFFANAELQLPLATRICIWMSEIFLDYLPVWLIGGIFLFLVLRFILGRPVGRLYRDRFLLRIPILGKVLIKAAMSRFASIFAILQASGIMILDAFSILQKTVGNEAIAAEFVRLRSSLKEGKGMANPLKSARYFPPLLISMVAIGEETGSLEEMMEKISKHYDQELQYQMKKLTDAIAPTLILVLSVVVGFFALAIYTPMWELSQMAR